MDSGKVILGFLAGAAAGAVLGILFAPDKGANTRAKIAHKGEDLVDDLKHKFGEFVDHVVDKFESSPNKAKDEAKAEAAQ